MVSLQPCCPEGNDVSQNACVSAPNVTASGRRCWQIPGCQGHFSELPCCFTWLLLTCLYGPQSLPVYKYVLRLWVFGAPGGSEKNLQSLSQQSLLSFPRNGMS